MVDLLRSLRITSRKAPFQRTARPAVEVLEDRAVPSASQVLTHVQADVRALTKALGTTASTTVQNDLTTVNGDLTNIANDIKAKTSAAQDLTKLASAVTQLGTDIGTSTSKAVGHDAKKLDQDIRTLANKLLSGAGEGDKVGASLAGRVQGDNVKLTLDVGALSKALSTNTNANVKADLTAIQNDQTAISAAVSAGTDATQAIRQLNTDLTKLGTDLGKKVGGQVRSAIEHVRNDARQLAHDLQGLAKRVQADAKDLQGDAKQLAKQLGANASTTVKDDLTALDAALTTLAADAAAGKDLSTDISDAFKAELTLAGDLKGQFSGKVAASLLDMSFDLAALSTLKG